MHTSLRRKLRSRLNRGFTLTAIAAAAALGGAFYAIAGHQATASLTGCLKTSTGTLSRLAVGDTPQSSCPSNHVVVHVSGGDITEVNAGNGLTGGGAQGAVTLSIATGGVGTAELSTSIPAVRAFHSVAQSIAGTRAPTVLAFDSERYDTTSMHDLSTNNSRLTAAVAGIYAITVSVAWASNASGFRSIHLRRNGGASIAVAQGAAAGGDEVGTVVASLAQLAAGDYVEVVALQNSGSNLDIQKGGEHSPEFAMTWLAPGP